MTGDVLLGSGSGAFVSDGPGEIFKSDDMDSLIRRIKRRLHLNLRLRLLGRRNDCPTVMSRELHTVT